MEIKTIITSWKEFNEKGKKSLKRADEAFKAGNYSNCKEAMLHTHRYLEYFHENLITYTKEDELEDAVENYALLMEKAKG